MQIPNSDAKFGITCNTLTLSGEMGKTVAQKLMLKPGQRLLVIDPPDGFLAALGELPPDAELLPPSAKQADTIQVFVSSLFDLRRAIPALKPRLARNGAIWVTYPKGMGNKPGGIHRDIIREYASTVGLQAVSLFSVDSTWSALRLKIVPAD